MPENNPITDAELAEVKRLVAAATPGDWRMFYGGEPLGIGASGELVGWMDRLRDAEVVIALHNAFPGILALIEDLQAYRDAVEAAKPTVQALLDSGERAASEVADLRQRLESAERERDELQMRLNGRNATGGRDALLKRLGVAEWLESEVELAKQSSRVWITYERDYFEQAAQRLREGGE